MNLRSLAAALVLTATPAMAGGLNHQTISSCIAYVHQTNPYSRFDAYLTQYGQVQFFASDRDLFTFDKCMEANGISLSDVPK
jgi:hypothetical protein